MKNFLLLTVALVLSPIIMPFGPIFAVAAAWRYQRTWRKVTVYLSKIAREVALCIDRLGNAVCGDLLNACMIEHGGYHFGVGRETISSALGQNQRRGTLTPVGNALASLLDWIDPNHCINAIEEF